jgi:hypothetical protein
MVNAYNACMRGCSNLGGAQSAFKDCIANAGSESDKRKCRDDYRNNRPNTD